MMSFLKLQNLSFSCVAGTFLVLALGFRLMLPAAAQSTTGTTLTAKSWYDPTTMRACYGDGNPMHDDTQNLQDLINFAITHQDAVALEPGTYVISSTIVIQAPPLPDVNPPHSLLNQTITGFHLYGLAGANRDGVPSVAGGNEANSYGGVSLRLAAGSTSALAVLEVGIGTFRDLSIENIGLVSQVPNNGTPYGLFFAETYFSGAYLHNVNASMVSTAFGEVQSYSNNTTPPNPMLPFGANGEFVNLLDCGGDNVNCFYSNTAGQAYEHRITNCQALINNGGTYIKIGNSVSLGFGLTVSSCSCSFMPGTFCNTFIENDGVSGNINVTGGRVEHCDRALYYAGGTANMAGIITISGLWFTDYTGNFPLIDATYNQAPNAQWTNTFSNCRFNAVATNPQPFLSVKAQTSDHSTNYFEKCVFVGFGNQLYSSGPPPTSIAGWSGIGGVIRDCRTTIGQSNVLSPEP